MKKKFPGTIAGITLVLISIFTLSGAPVDRSRISVRIPDIKIIKKYQKDTRFEYQNQGIDSGYSQILNEWLQNLILKLFPDNTKVPEWVSFYNFILFIVISATAVTAFLLIRSKRNGLFYATNNIDGSVISGLDNGMNTADIDSLLKQSIENKQYSLAIRFYFHKVLQEMAAHSIIELKDDKTNQDYIHEIQKDSVKSLFKDLAIQFEYVWYGKFALDKKKFTLLAEEFKSFLAAIQA